MAKKRKKDQKEEQEEYEFVPPDFDEKEFLRKEIKDTRASLITIGVAAVFGIFAWGLASINSSLILPSLLLGVVGIFLLKFIYQLVKVDVSHFQKKNWVGVAGTFFFTFLAVTVLMINIPFLDLADPTVDKVIIWVDDGTELHGLGYDSVSNSWTIVAGDENWTKVIHSQDEVNITAHVTDNGRLSVVEIAVSPSIDTYTSMVKDGDSRYEHSITGDQLSHQALSFYIRAVDGAGNSVFFSPAATISVV